MMTDKNDKDPALEALQKQIAQWISTGHWWCPECQCIADGMLIVIKGTKRCEECETNAIYIEPFYSDLLRATVTGVRDDYERMADERGTHITRNDTRDYGIKTTCDDIVRDLTKVLEAAPDTDRLTVEPYDIGPFARDLEAAPAGDTAPKLSIIDALEQLVNTVYDVRDHHPTAEWLALQDAERVLKANDEAAPVGGESVTGDETPFLERVFKLVVDPLIPMDEIHIVADGKTVAKLKGVGPPNTPPPAPGIDPAQVRELLGQVRKDMVEEKDEGWRVCAAYYATKLIALISKADAALVPSLDFGSAASVERTNLLTEIHAVISWMETLPKWIFRDDIYGSLKLVESTIEAAPDHIPDVRKMVSIDPVKVATLRDELDELADTKDHGKCNNWFSGWNAGLQRACNDLTALLDAETQEPVNCDLCGASAVTIRRCADCAATEPPLTTADRAQHIVHHFRTVGLFGKDMDEVNALYIVDMMEGKGDDAIRAHITGGGAQDGDDGE